MVVCVFKTLWLCKASGDGEQFHPSFVLLVVFKILGCPSVVLLFLFSNSCPHLAMMERNFVQVLFFFFFLILGCPRLAGMEKELGAAETESLAEEEAHIDSSELHGWKNSYNHYI